ncbi:MAG: zinc ribbon domain-containing protein [Chlorobium sp.]|nr:zinc ribbon domain-containing protein [Chlorobium sp.]
MALIRCSECNKEISDKASACPGCGCPAANQDRPVSVTTSQYVLSHEVFKSILARLGAENNRLFKLIIVCSNGIDEKTVNALSACRVPNDDVLIAYVDLTVFGSAKDAICFTNHSLYYKFQDSYVYIPYSEITNYTFNYIYESPWVKVLKDNNTFCEFFIKDDLSMLGLVLDAVRDKFDTVSHTQKSDDSKHETITSIGNNSPSIGVYVSDSSSGNSNPSRKANSSGFPYMTVVSVLIIIVIAIICSKLFDSRGIESYGSDMYAMREDAENSARLVQKLIYVLFIMSGVWLGLAAKKMISKRI